jgi:DDE superfamily endonuclease
MLDGLHTQADLGYVGVEGVDLSRIKRRPGQATLDPYDTPFDISLATIRAAVERAVAHVRTWRMLSEEAGRFRPPLEKFAETLAAITGLLNLRRFFNPASE